MADWQRTRLAIVRAEQPDVDDEGMIVFRSDEEEARFHAEAQDRSAYARSPLSATMSYEEWRELNEFKAWQRAKVEGKQAAVAALGLAPPLPGPRGSKPFKELTAVFLAHLKHRLSQTKPNMKSDEDISQSRVTQYGFALAHLDATVGGTPIEPAGEFHIAEKPLVQILGRYRQACKDEMTAKDYTGHWFNERMKTVRAFVTFLVAHRLLDREPPNIMALVEKYQIAPNAKPIPLPILRAIWAEADPKFRCHMLLALNCGFRQSEIQGLTRHQIHRVAGHLCIVKPRGKTGVPIALPLWQATQDAIARHAAADGTLFDWPDAKTAMAALYHQMKAIRKRVAKRLPKAADYSFEHFRDTGATYVDGVNPMLTPLYLGQGDTRQVKHYVGAIEDDEGNAIVPMQLDKVLGTFESYLDLENGAAAR